MTPILLLMLLYLLKMVLLVMTVHFSFMVAFRVINFNVVHRADLGLNACLEDVIHGAGLRQLRGPNLLGFDNLL